jgi:nicotinamide-nucleotide amidase
LQEGDGIRDALIELFPKHEIVFVTGGLGPTTDDITREIVSDLLGLEVQEDETILSVIRERLTRRRIPFTNRIARQAQVPRGAIVLPNENGTAPGFYLRRNVSPTISSPDLFVLPGPPRELQPMFRGFVLPLLRSIAPAPTFHRRLYRIVNMGESMVEKAIGEKVLALPGIELGYCARNGEVDLRVIGNEQSIEEADTIINTALAGSIFSTTDESLEEVLVKLLTECKKTLAVAESCTGGLRANRLTNVAGASNVFLAGYVVYSNDAKIDVLAVDPKLIQGHGAVSEPVARAMAEGARNR